MPFDDPALKARLVALRSFGVPGSVVILQGVGTGFAYVDHPQMRIMSLCVSIAFLCLTVYLSVCLSLYLYLSAVCLSAVCLSVCLSLPPSQHMFVVPKTPLEKHKATDIGHHRTASEAPFKWRDTCSGPFCGYWL